MSGGGPPPARSRSAAARYRVLDQPVDL